MSPPSKHPLRPDRIRQIPDQFSWIDRAFVRRGLIAGLRTEAIALYYFLITVGDRLGLSFYSDRRVCELLAMDAERLQQARQSLIQQDLLAYSYPLYQVLALPIAGGPQTPELTTHCEGFQSLRQVFCQLGNPAPHPQHPAAPGGRHDR